MKRKDLIQKLKSAGYLWVREGDHTNMVNPDVPKDDLRRRALIQVPRHTEINEITAKNILKQAGIHDKR